MDNLTESFGELVFSDRAMSERMSDESYRALKDAIRSGEPLDINVANAVADAMKAWALEKGATHYTHWFQPLTGVTAEKHEGFLGCGRDGSAIMTFSGKELIQGEPDASSFPSGGLRATFEARGYTAWDPTSHAFIKDATLCIPTLFFSYGGDALDKKTPLLRSMDLINRECLRILKLFGHEDVKKVISTSGAEQEYFLVEKSLYDQRPDLVLCSRTLFGAKSPKGQEMDDHYYGAISPRVSYFMRDLDTELWQLGVFAKTEHKEVAPGQYELAPVFADSNTATDHNQLVMEIMKKTALRHGMVCLLHEKPFAGVNGSGKHNNWSMSTSTENLLDPGDTPMENLQFLVFLAAVIKAVDEYADLLRTSVATPGNDHRLGANEAPPAIISIFVGEELEAVIDAIASDSPYAGPVKMKMDLGVDVLPKFSKDTTDRNRTSPFAFTGNRFEFRAVGSEANCASAMIALNSALAEQLTEFKKDVDELIEKGEPKISAILEVIRRYIKVCKPIHFDGNGYSDEWKAEAARRGLDCETSVPVIFDNYLKPESIRMFESIGVMTKKELEARNEVKWEMYTKKIQIEARVLGDLAMNHIIPVATQYQSDLIDNVYKMKDLFPAEKAAKLSAKNLELIEEIADRTAFIKEHVDAMIEARKVANKIESEREKAIAYHDNIVPMMEEIRYHIDKLELIVDNQMWTLPKYRELLFIR